MRDNFRQAAVDLMAAARLIEDGDWSGLPDIPLDATSLVYTGESFGAILGGTVVAIDPAVPAAVLSAAGGGQLLDLVGNSATLGTLFQPLVSGTFDQHVVIGDPDANPVRAQMSLNLLQTILEPGDPLALAPAAAAASGKSVLFLEAFNDEVVSNHATEALAA